MGVVSFMKASSWLPSILRDTPGENLDPLDQAVAAVQCRSLPEGAVLEFLDRRTRHRLLLGWRCRSLAPLYLALGACRVVWCGVVWCGVELYAGVVWSLLYL